MPEPIERLERLAAVVALAEQVDRPSFGRTALMKCAYFLQTLKGMPLGYRFSLYTYGPYDSDVLQDLDYAQHLGALSVDLISYPSGYGYSIRTGPNAEAVLARAKAFLDRHRKQIEEVAQEFGPKSAVALELDSAIIYISRSPEFQNSRRKLDEIVEHVRAIKPRFSEEEIRNAARDLVASGHLDA